MAEARIVYCLTRDREFATALDERLSGALAFFYNDAARLSQAVVLRVPDLIVVDTRAIRADYGDAGLGPIFDYLRRQTPDTILSVRPAPGTEVLVTAEAGPRVTLLPADRAACVDRLHALLLE